MVIRVSYKHVVGEEAAHHWTQDVEVADLNSGVETVLRAAEAAGFEVRQIILPLPQAQEAA